MSKPTEVKTVVLNSDTMIALTTAYMLACERGIYVGADGCSIMDRDVPKQQEEFFYGLQNIAKILGNEAVTSIQADARSRRTTRVILSMNDFRNQINRIGALCLFSVVLSTLALLFP